MRRFYPAPAEDAHLTEDADLAAAYAFPEASRQPWVRAVFVASADGAAAVDGRAGGLGSEADQKLFALLRGLADVVLAGAGTVRAEGYGPVKQHQSWGDVRAGRPPTPPVAVVSRRLDLDPSSPLFTQAPGHAQTMVITCAAAPQQRLRALRGTAEVIIAGAERVDLAEAVRTLGRRGHMRISCEGGPRLHAQIAGAGLLDELCLTLSPLLLAGNAQRITDGAPVPGGLPMRLASVLEDGGYLFLRYIRRASPGPSCPPGAGG